jgi:hypothetical protein
MNKAFIKEADGDLAACPKCGTAGHTVYRQTLEAQLPEEMRKRLTESAFFCPSARCPVVYFDLFDRLVEEHEVPSPVYPKNPNAPLCACFGLTADDIEQDIAEGGVARTRACVEKARSALARCAERSPSGQSCIAFVQSYYMQRKGRANP